MKKTLKDLRAEDHANELTRILLIDDHVSFRQTLANVLERQPEFKVVGKQARWPRHASSPASR
jgi:DNA-binding NarL/FixJ family response regulator